MSDREEAFRDLTTILEGLNWRSIFILAETRHGKPLNHRWWAGRLDQSTGIYERLEEGLSYTQLAWRTYENHVGPLYVYQIEQLALADYITEFKPGEYQIYTTGWWGSPYRTEAKAIEALSKLPFPGRVMRYTWNPEEEKVGLTAGVRLERWATYENGLIPFYWPARLTALGAMTAGEVFVEFAHHGLALIRNVNGEIEEREYHDATYSSGKRKDLNP